VSKEVFDALGDIASYALSVDDGIRGDYKYPTKAGVTHVLAFDRDEHQYVVRAPASKRYFGVDYELRLTTEFEDYFQSNPEEVDSILEDHELELEQAPQSDRIQAAAKFHVDSLPSEGVQAVTEQISQRMTQVNCQHEWLVAGDDGQVWDGFRVTRRIYPYEDDFSVRDFDQAVIDTIGVGYWATATLSENLDLSIDIEEEEPTASGRAFQ